MKKYLVIAVVLVIGVIVGAALLLLGDDTRPAPTGTPSAVPTATPADAGPLLERYSSEFGTAYFNYSRIDDPKYLDSIRPFLGKDLFAEVAADNRRTGSRAPALRSDVLSAETVEQASDVATVKLSIRSRETGSAPFDRVFRLDWTKQGERWVISQFVLESTTRKHPYLEQ